VLREVVLRGLEKIPQVNMGIEAGTVVMPLDRYGNSMRKGRKPTDHAFILKCFASSVLRRPRSFVSHSQMVNTAQPDLLSSSSFLRSLARLAANFVAQNSIRVLGVVAFGQFLCRCQKQPFTNTTVRCFERTRSGVPGRSLRWSRNRNPNACSALRTFSSGRVSYRLTLRMMLLAHRIYGRFTIAQARNHR
jgi:hypothetical protein